MLDGCKIEICCGSTADAVAAYKGGAYSVELCSDLFHGGLTPSMGSLITVRKQCPKLKIMCMVRPREGGFNYSDLDFETMLEDARQFIKNGADGIVFGFLHDDGTIDEGKCEKMLEVIGDKESVFHRAIDVTPDWRKSMDVLIRLGITRVLTSGQMPTVPEGMETINEMIKYAEGRIQVMLGAGITMKNASWVRMTTGADRLHVALHRTVYDSSTLGNPYIYYGGCVYPPEDRYSVTAAKDVREFIESIKD